MQSEKKRERRMLIHQNRSEAIIALCIAAIAGNLAEVKQWLELAPSLINDTHFGRTPLAWAVAAPNPDVFFYLLSNGADTTARYPGHTLAENVALYCRWLPIEKEAALQALAEKGVTLNPFLLAAWRGSAEALSQEALLTRDTLHNNVAHYASASGQVLLLQQLHTIQPQLFTREIPSLQSLGRGRHSLFLWAAMNGYLTAVQWSLREGGAQITERSSSGNTALLGAASHGHLEVVQWLLHEGGAQITERNDFDETALLLAARSKHEEIVNWLISEFGADPGDGMAIAKLLGASGNARVKKARELQALFFAYHLRQQPAVNKRLLQAALPNFPDVLRGMIAEYAQYPQPSEQKPALPVAILLQNNDLLRELQAHAKSWNFFLSWRDLARELITTIETQHPCHALTIHLAVKDFLAVHANQIAGSRLSNILQAILDKTDYFEPRAVEAPPETERGQKEAVKSAVAGSLSWANITSYFRRRTPGSTTAPADGKPQHARPLSPQGPLSPPPPASPTEITQDTARTTRLIQWLTHLAVPRLHTINWQRGREGRAIAYFDDETQARDIMALLRGQQPELSLQLGSQSSSTSSAIRYELSVQVPEGITLLTTPTARSTATSAHQGTLYVNPLLNEEQGSRNSP